jgi:MoaA/NifB/PqqE/SkfB family radical SAM enzyme
MEVTEHDIENWAKQFKYISLTGGEPTLHPKFTEIVKGLKEHRVYVHVAHNGTQLDRIKDSIKYIDGISISLDGDRETHNRHRGRDIYDQVIETAKYVRGKVKIATINMLITNENYNKVIDMAEFVNTELGLPLSFSYPSTPTLYSKGYVFGKEFSVTQGNLVEAFSKAYYNYDRFVFGNTKRFYKECIDYTLGRKVSPCRAGKVINVIDIDKNLKACWMKDKYTKNCNECFLQCFREPSIFAPIEQAKLLFRIYRFTRK